MHRHANHDDEFIGSVEMGRLLSIDTTSCRKVAEAAGIRIRVIPGLPTKYHRADVEKIAADSIRVANRGCDVPKGKKSKISA